MKLKRLVAGLTALAMTASLFTFTAFADNDESGSTSAITEISFTSTLNLNADAVTAPEVTYTYTLAKGTAAEIVVDSTDTSSATVVVYADETNTLPEAVEISFETSDLAEKDTDTGYMKVSETVTIDVSSLEFSQGGFYVYTLTQISDTDEDSSAEDENFINDTETHYLYLQVAMVNDSFGITKYLVSDYTLSNLQEDSSKLNGFTNYYGCDTDGDDEPTPTSESLKFIVTAYSFGDMANSSQAFQYTVSTTADKGTVYNVVYGSNLTLKVGDDGYLYEATLNTTQNAYEIASDATPYVFSLAETSTGTSGVETSFTIKAVAVNETFTVTVKDSADLGYDVETRKYTTVGGTEWTEIAVELTSSGTDYTYKMVAYGSITEDDTDGYTQGRDVATIKGNDLNEDDDTDDEDDDGIDYNGISLPDTGVILEFAPFALMVLAAGAFISLRAMAAAKQRK